MKPGSRWFFYLLFQAWVFAAFGVEPIQPIVRFSTPSIKVGEPVKLSLSVRYKSDLQILAPDTNYSFLPFELLKKEYYPTKTQQGISLDSVVYFLATFELDSLQSIQIPVFQFTAKDSTEWLSNRAYVQVGQTFKGPLPDKPVFENQTSPLPVPQFINYPYAIIGFGVVVLIILAVNFFFNRPIQRFVYLFIEKRRHDTYLRQFEKINSQLNSQLSVANMERLLNLWKKYLQRVDAKPYTTYTSIEMFKVLPDKVLKETLQDIDRWIYGGMEMKDLQAHVQYIRQISLQLYHQKRERIRNGKFE